MTGLTALAGARIFDGSHWHDGAAVLVRGGKIVDIVPRSGVPAERSRRDRSTAACWCRASSMRR